MHILPHQEGPAANCAALDLPAQDDVSWGMMVDMMEAQLMQRPRLLGSCSWQGSEPLDGDEFAAAPQMFQSTAITPGPKSVGKASSRLSGEERDTCGARDQTTRSSAGTQTPGVSHLASQAESLFAAVASAAAVRSSGHRSGSVPPLGLLLGGSQAAGVFMEQDEVFEAPDGEWAACTGLQHNSHAVVANASRPQHRAMLPSW